MTAEDEEPITALRFGPETLLDRVFMFDHWSIRLQWEGGVSEGSNG